MSDHDCPVCPEGEGECPVNVEAARGALDAIEACEKYLARAYDDGCRTWPETMRAMEAFLGEELANQMVRLIHPTWEMRFRPVIAADIRAEHSRAADRMLADLDAEIAQLDHRSAAPESGP